MFLNTIAWLWSALYYYLVNHYNGESFPYEGVSSLEKADDTKKFEVIFQWTYLNYTWESTEDYINAVQNGRYIPANNAPTGLKFHESKMFLTIPRFRPGVPVTLAYTDVTFGLPDENPLLTPYPNWDSNDDTRSCSNLQSVQSLEVDTRGVMWIIDGVRINNYTRCPAKLVLLDLNNGGELVHSHFFPERLASRHGGFLNDIVIDETDGDFAYITDNNPNDPGIIVFSRSANRAWKLRDESMHPEPEAMIFKVDDLVFDNPTPVDGIALSRRGLNGEKTLFYCAISSFTIYSIRTNIIKNRALVKSGEWRSEIVKEGTKNSQSDGIIIDESSNMYLTMLPDYGVATWNVQKPFSTMHMLDANKETMIWPDGFAFDQQGNLYLISNKVFNYIDLRRTPRITDEPNFRILRLFTGTKSYLYD